MITINIHDVEKLKSEPIKKRNIGEDYYVRRFVAEDKDGDLAEITFFADEQHKLKF